MVEIVCKAFKSLLLESIILLTLQAFTQSLHFKDLYSSSGNCKTSTALKHLNYLFNFRGLLLCHAPFFFMTKLSLFRKIRLVQRFS